MEVFAIGSRVRMTSLDKFGFTGRDLHPSAEDLGFEGVIVAIADRAETLDTGPLPEDDQWVCYRCCSAEGRVLELMDSEVVAAKAGESKAQLVAAFQRAIRRGTAPTELVASDEVYFCTGEAEGITVRVLRRGR